jgi:hypothetical protein
MRHEANGNLDKRRALLGAKCPTRPRKRAVARGIFEPEVIAPAVENDDEDGGSGPSRAWRRLSIAPKSVTVSTFTILRASTGIERLFQVNLTPSSGAASRE